MTSTIRTLARDLQVGDYLVTSIGTAPITAIVPDRGGLAVHLDIRHERSTRPESETRVLWLYPGEQVRFRPATEAPSLNAARARGRECPPAFLRRSTGRHPGTTPRTP